MKNKKLVFLSVAVFLTIIILSAGLWPRTKCGYTENIDSLFAHFQEGDHLLECLTGRQFFFVEEYSLFLRTRQIYFWGIITPSEIDAITTNNAYKIITGPANNVPFKSQLPDKLYHEMGIRESGSTYTIEGSLEKPVIYLTYRHKQYNIFMNIASENGAITGHINVLPVNRQNP